MGYYAHTPQNSDVMEPDVSMFETICGLEMVEGVEVQGD